MLKANPFSVTAMFEETQRYLVPLFQRPYVWEKERHWEPLWEDIRTQAELDDGPELPKHFLGAVILSEERTHRAEVKRTRIIDGQQRLTTLQVLIAAVRDLARPVNTDLADDLARLTTNTGRLVTTKASRLKLTPTRGDIAVFTAVVTAGSRAKVIEQFPTPAKQKGQRGAPPDLRPPLVRAYLYFSQTIEDWAQAGDFTDRLSRIADTLDKRLELVAIELDAAQDPQVIFESLNGRNEPLGPADLLRNFIFRRVEEGTDEATAEARLDELYDRYWAPFDISDDPQKPDAPRFWQERHRQGRLERSRIDLFIQHYLAMHRGTDVNVSRLFHEYKGWAVPAKTAPPFPTVEAELADLHEAAAKYRTLLQPSLDTRLGLCASRLQTLDTTTAYPLLLALALNRSVTAELLEAFAAELESYLVRRLVCDISTQGLNRLFATLAREARNAGTLARSWLGSRLKDQSSEGALRFPSDADFEKAWMREPVYKRMSSARLEMILRALNRAHANAYNGGILPPPELKLTVEHVLPRKWETNWPLGSALSREAQEAAAERRDVLKHTIGNLTLVTQPLNAALSNDTYPKKREKFVVHAGLWLNGWFQTRDGWDEAAIEERGAALFKIARDIWPEPVS